MSSIRLLNCCYRRGLEAMLAPLRLATIPYTNAVLEISPDLSPDSWDILDFPTRLENEL